MEHKNLPSGYPRLSDGEWEIMKPFWKYGPMAARDVYDKVPDHLGWAYKTVKTMLARLVKKGALEYSQIGNSYLYRPAYSQGEMVHAATTAFVKRVFDGDTKGFLSTLAETLSPEEARAVRSQFAGTGTGEARKPRTP